MDPFKAWAHGGRKDQEGPFREWFTIETTPLPLASINRDQKINGNT